jgi:VCBS repeat-containing protein
MATAAGSHPIGKVFILQGTAKAVATDGAVRVLGPNSIIYADERIITESDGAVSIMLDGPPPAQIDLGRMSDVLLNEDVYAGATPEVVKDASTDADKIQEALAQGDQPIELDATAAGGGAGAGGSHTLANFALDGSEVSPGSGADTTGAAYGTVGTLLGTQNSPPVAVPDDNLQHGDIPGDAVTEAGAKLGHYVYQVYQGEGHGGDHHHHGGDQESHSYFYNDPVSGDPTAKGNLLTNDTDPNPGDTLTVTTTGTFEGTYGSVTIGADGEWIYTLNNADPDTNALAQGELATEVFTYTITDGHGGTSSSTLTITIEGTDDIPTAHPDVNGEDTVTEAGVVVSDGQMIAVAGDPTAHGNVLANDTDVDHGDTLTVTTTGNYMGANGIIVQAASNYAGEYGNAHIAANGDWTYTLNNADHDTQALAQGETATETFTYVVKDANGLFDVSTLTITITGTNDAPVITSSCGNDHGQVEEDGSIIKWGDWTLLNEQMTSGHLEAVDPDHGDHQHWSIDGNPTSAYGHIEVNSNGTWTYVLNNGAVQFLAADEHLHDTFTVKVTDDSGAFDTQQVTITIQGTNDAPVIFVGEGDKATGSVSEGDPLHGADMTVTGHLSHSDVDTSDTHAFSVTHNSHYGNTSVNNSGNWTYTVRDSGAVDHLAVGEHLSDSFTVQVSDGHGGFDTQVVTIDIVGTNDAPDIFIDACHGDKATGTVSEGDPLHGTSMTATGTLSHSDVDTHDTHSFSLVGTAAAYGTASVNASTGAWSYTVSDSGAVDHLAVGETMNDSFTVQVSDGHGGYDTQAVTITIVGTNDAPDIFVDASIGDKATGSVSEGDPLHGADMTATGTLSHSDVDTHDTHSFSIVGTAAAYGAASVNASTGTWSYTVSDSGAVDALNAGQHLSDSFTVQVSDGHGGTDTQVVTIDITGTNDGPVVAADIIITNEEEGHSFQIPDWALLHNDTGAISISGVSNTGDSADTVSHSGNAVTFTDADKHDPASSFDYVATNTSGSATAHVAVFTTTGSAIGTTGEQSAILVADVDDTNLNGGNSADILIGGAGNDHLKGFAGNDILYGGAGHDELTGGTGADVFKFTATSDSSTNHSLSDVITDFNHAEGDKIDLSAIDAKTQSGNTGDQAFTFIATENANTVANSITWTHSGGDTIIHIDNTGDTTADMTIILDGILTPVTDDFIK